MVEDFPMKVKTGEVSDGEEWDPHEEGKEDGERKKGEAVGDDLRLVSKAEGGKTHKSNHCHLEIQLESQTQEEIVLNFLLIVFDLLSQRSEESDFASFRANSGKAIVEMKLEFMLF